MAIRLTESRLRQIIKEEINEMGRRWKAMPVKQVIDLSRITTPTGASRPDRMYRYGGMSELELRRKLTAVCDMFGCTWLLKGGSGGSPTSYPGGGAPGRSYDISASVEISGPDEESVQTCVDELASMGIP